MSAFCMTVVIILEINRRLYKTVKYECKREGPDTTIWTPQREEFLFGNLLPYFPAPWTVPGTQYTFDKSFIE